MPIPLTNGPGVYIQELQNPVRPIVGVSTSMAAFYGQAPQGIVNYPYQVNSWGDYQAEFGGLSTDYPLSYAVFLFFLNGGNTGLVVRYDDGSTPATAQLADTTLVASSPGTWAQNLSAVVDTNNLVNTNVNQFNLTITNTDGTSESYPGVSLTPNTPQYLGTQLLASQFVDAAASTIGTTVPGALTVAFKLASAAADDDAGAGAAGGAGGAGGAGAEGAGAGGAAAGGAGPGGAGAGGAGAGGAGAGGAGAGGAGAGGAAAGGAGAEGAGAGGAAAGGAGAGGAGAGGAGAGGAAAPADTNGPLNLGNQDLKTGIYALLKADIFNILCLPVDPANTYGAQALEDGGRFLREAARHADRGPAIRQELGRHSAHLQHHHHSAPGLLPGAQRERGGLLPQPGAHRLHRRQVQRRALRRGGRRVGGDRQQPRRVEGAGRNGGDDHRHRRIHGAGGRQRERDASTRWPSTRLRTMPAVGPVVWGARTTVGADQAQSQWKYLPVRRIALYIEESLRRGTQWAVFEPNDEPLWSSLRLNVTTFMQGLFRRVLSRARPPRTRTWCSATPTTTRSPQIDLGIVNILVGFAPLYPAEFVIISIQQQAGQA